MSPSSPAVNLEQLLQLAHAKHHAGDVTEAVRLYHQALKALPRSAELMQLIGAAYLQAGDLVEAEKWLHQAVKIDPKSASIHANLGVVYRRSRRPQDAVRSCRTAISLSPELANAHYNLGRAHFDLAEFGLAVDAMRQAARLSPNDPEILVSLGAAIFRNSGADLRNWREAHDIYQRALRLRSEMPEALAGIGNLMVEKGWARAATAYYNRAVAAGANQGKFRYMRAASNLLLGNVGQGLDDYDFRFNQEGPDLIVRRATPPPYWEGEDLAGKHIYVWSEQGLGDQIIYAHCLADVIARAGRVSIESKPRLTKVFTRSFPAAQILGRRTEKVHVPSPRGADFQISIASLGRFLRREFSDFPHHHGFLKPSPEKAAHFRRKYLEMAAGRKIVGVSWRSRNVHLGEAKSSNLSEWRDILTVEDTWLVNLQYGDCAEDLRAVRDTMGIEIYQDPEVDPLGDLDDSFAQISALDLFVSTSNTAVHIAGSMAIPTWVLLPGVNGTMWYWFLDRTDSPWYPSVRLYRASLDAPTAEPWWRPVVPRVARDLKSWVGQTRRLEAHG